MIPSLSKEVSIKLLTVCNQGNNRSVTLAHLVKYWKHDVISAGLDTNSPETLDMLYKWADVIIRTAKDQVIPEQYQHKVKTFNLGADTYPRPHNPELLALVKKYLEAHKDWLKP